MAERQGFEPWVGCYPHNRLAGGCLRPARPPLHKQIILTLAFVFVNEKARLRRVFALVIFYRLFERIGAEI